MHFFPRQTSVIDVHIYRSSIYAEYFEYPSIPSRIQTILSSGKSSLAFVREKRGGERDGQTKIDPFPLPFSPSFFDSSIPRFPELALRSRAPTNASSSEPCKAVRGREDRRKKGGGQRHPCNHQRLTHSFHPCFPPCFSSSLRALILLPAHTRCRERETYGRIQGRGWERISENYPRRNDRCCSKQIILRGYADVLKEIARWCELVLLDILDSWSVFESDCGREWIKDTRNMGRRMRLMNLLPRKWRGRKGDAAFNLILFSFDSIQKDRSFLSFFLGREERWTPFVERSNLCGSVRKKERGRARLAECS